MKDVKVLGMGCANCKRTAQLIESVANEAGVTIALTKVEDLPEMERGRGNLIFGVPGKKAKAGEELMVSATVVSKPKLTRLLLSYVCPATEAGLM